MAMGRYEDVLKPEQLKAGFAEFIATFIFVFIGEGSCLAFDKVTDGTTITPGVMLNVAICHGFAIHTAISISLDVSGGHLNPAVTVSLLIGGYITMFKSLLYIFAQLAGSVLACVLLQVVTNGSRLPIHSLTRGEPVHAAVMLETIFTFILLYSIYALAVDPRSKSACKASVPLAIGFLVTAITLYGGAYGGASMNPARSFGPALMNWSWENQWVYWLGPLLGGAIAGFVYELMYMGGEPAVHELLSDEKEQDVRNCCELVRT